MIKVTLPQFVAVLFIFLCLPAVIIHAGGQTEEDQIRQARAMMDSQDYRAALKLLVKIRESNADLRELTQAYFDECFFHVERVTNLEKEILAAIDSFDEEKTLEKMEHLKQLDKAEFDIFFNISYQRRLYAKNRNEFVQLMDKAYVLVQASQWREAIDTYKKALGVYRNDFFEDTSFGNIIPGNVQALLIELDTLLARYYAGADTTAKSVNAVTDLLSAGRLTEGLRGAEAVNRDMLSLLLVRQRIIDVGTKLVLQNEALNKATDNGIGHYYLIFSAQVVLGRRDREDREGLYYVVERHWEQFAREMTALMRATADRRFSLAQENTRAGNAVQAVTNYELAGRLAERGLSFLGQYVTTAAAGATRRLDKRDREYVRHLLPQYHYLGERRLESRLYTNLLSSRKLYDTINQRPLGDDAALRKTQAEVRGIIGTLSDNVKLLETRQALFATLTTNGFDVTEAARSIPELLSRLTDLLTAYQKLDTGFTVKFVERDYLPIRDALADREKKFARAKSLRNGTSTENPIEKNKKYPTRAINEYRALQSELRSLENLIADFLGQWSVTRQYLEKDEKIKEYITAVRTAETGINTLRENILDEIETATQQHRLAVALYREARDDFTAAANALKQKQFKETLSYLERSKTKAVNSLSNEEDPNVRRFLDNDIAILERDTNNASREKLFDEAQAEYSRAIDFYKLQRFDDAQASLDRAKKSLSEFPEETTKDVLAGMDIWDQLIKKAKTIQGKLELTGKEPNYEVTRKTLNNAEAEYKAGVELQKKSDRAGAAKRFANSRALLAQINEQYPRLKESGELFLKILKAEGEATYKQEIARRIGDAVKTNDPRRSLTELEPILAIDPNYPGLRALINSIRDKLYKPPEVDAVSRKKSQDLTALARRYFLTPTRQNLDNAEKAINEALRLDRYNEAAAALQLEIKREISRK
jgi:flagellin-specific chaperone FliS